MSFRFFCLFIVYLGLTMGIQNHVYSQPLTIHLPLGPIDDRYSTIQQNSISSLEAGETSLWMGPGLNAFFEMNGEIYAPQNADSVFNARGRAFSLSVEAGRILAGLGFTSTMGGSSVNAAQGYYQSYDEGASWNFIPFPLDDRPSENDNCTANSVGPPCDIEFQYGSETYIRTRITVPEQSPPFEVDFFENTLLSVNWASGLLRSTDSGETWERIILPPSFELELTPDGTYQWFSQTPDGETVNRYDPRYDNNLLGFGLLIDDRKRVWVGTAAGINISDNALYAPADQIKWRRAVFEPGNDTGLLANWIQKIRQQPGTNRIWMTNWRADPDNRDTNGVVYTDDGGETFRHFLEGVRANDIGFFNDQIYVAADNGLYISDDDGESWEQAEQIRSPNTFIKRDARYFAVDATDENLWVGTSDGLASTNDGGNTWRIIRTDVPLSGGNIYQPDAPDVDAYAYPNPFSPAIHTQVRIKYQMDEPGSATIRIYDFGMNPVRTIRVDSVSSAGAYEVTWDGTDNSGRLAANGTYFYTIETPAGTAHGKILLID